MILDYWSDFIAEIRTVDGDRISAIVLDKSAIELLRKYRGRPELIARILARGLASKDNTNGVLWLRFRGRVVAKVPILRALG
jgi:hypothetical protein